MNIPSPDLITERKFLKRKLFFWKLAAILTFIGIIAIALSPSNSKVTSTASLTESGYIAEVNFNEIIFDDRDRDKNIRALADDKKIKAVIITINSPGGTVVGSQNLYSSIEHVSKNKPVAVLMKDMATSGGYMASLGATRIFAHESTLTGSIGVILQTMEYTELADKIGVKFNLFKSGHLKAVPNPMEKVTPEVREATMDVVMSSYDFFVGLVAKKRNLSLEQARNVATGRVYTGMQAHKLKLVDEIGNFESVVAWLQKDQKIDKKYKVHTVPIKKKKFFEELMEETSNFLPYVINKKLVGLLAIYTGK